MFRHLTNCPNPELAVNLFVVTSLFVGSRTKIDIVIGKLPKSEYAGCVTSRILSSCEIDAMFLFLLFFSNDSRVLYDQ